MGTAVSKQWARWIGAGQGACVVAWHVRAADSEWVTHVWQGAQAEAGLPAPALAVDGIEGWLVCFALPEPRPSTEACAALRELIRGLLRHAGVSASAGEVAAWRFSCWPQDLPAAASGGADEAPVPRQMGADRWSAFVAPDLVPVFAESPWLDCPPSEDGQAALMARLQPMSTADWARLVKASGPDVAPSRAHEPGLSRQADGAVADDPRSFLTAVMNDASVDMALRIEAARVLLAHG